jgi:hypothetical protein
VRPLKVGKRVARGFVLIDPPGYRTEAALLKWVAEGLSIAKTLAKQPAAAKPRAVR